MNRSEPKVTETHASLETPGPGNRRYAMRTTSYILPATALLTLPWALAQPVFAEQPTNNPVSLGATAQFAAAATSTAAPIR